MPSGVYDRKPYDGRMLLERLFKGRVIDPVTGCWLWSRLETRGYGQIFFDYRGKKFKVSVHRLVAWLYLDYNGQTDREVCHRCNVKACFNPTHLYLATRQQNILDAVRDGLIKHRRGAAHYEARFSEQQVRDIRARASAGETYNSLAVEFRVHRSTIRRLVIGKTWKHLATSLQ